MTAVEFTIFSIILGGCALLVVGMYIVVLMRSRAWRKRKQLSAMLQPQIREALVDFMAGSDNRPKIREFLQRSRHDVGDAMLAFQTTVGGGARDRLCELALEQALVHDWCQDGHVRDVVRRRTAFERLAFVSSNEPCRRVAGDMIANALDDSDAEVRFSAAIAVLQAGSAKDVERVFQLALTRDLQARILLAEELRRHAALLCKSAVPAVLASDNHEAVLAALEVLVAWERALPLSDLRSVLSHPNRDIRTQALRLTMLVPLTIDTQGAILDALSDSDPEVALVACNCAGRLHIEAALPGLARCLRRGPSDLARAAASALADMPPRGWTTLQELAASENSVTADAAREALARAQGKAGS
jgi:hypothetical protein